MVAINPNSTGKTLKRKKDLTKRFSDTSRTSGWVCPRCGGEESRYDGGLTWCIACRFWVEGQPNDNHEAEEPKERL